MPRGQKSKLRAREKRQHNRTKTQGLKMAQGDTAKEEPVTFLTSLVSQFGTWSSRIAGILWATLTVLVTSRANAGVSCQTSDVNAKSEVQKCKNSSQASTYTESSGPDLLTKKASKLVQFLLCNYKVNEPIKKSDILKVVHKRYRKQFPEILRKASDRMDLVFGLQLKEVNANNHFYTLFCNPGDTSDGGLCRAWHFPTRGILMPLLGVIFLNGNRASEEEVWQSLNILGIYDGKTHCIFGEPRKLITQDLVKQKYLQYRQVRNSAPPRYEFLWGPRAKAETTKMKVLEFLSTVNDSDPSDFPSYYEEARRDEEERARAVAATKAGTTSKASARSKATSSRYTHHQ